MTRPKGSKNRPKTVGGGNPDFNLNEVEPSQTIGEEVASGAVLPEDLELEASLARMQAFAPDIDDPEPIGSVLQKEKIRVELLREAVEDYQVATSRQEITDQVYLAKVEGCDSIEATLEAIHSICRDKSLESVGYFIFKDIKVYIEGFVERAKARDNQTIEQRLFGHTTLADKNKQIKDKIRQLEAELD